MPQPIDRFLQLDHAASRRAPWEEIDAILSSIYQDPASDRWIRSECVARRLYLADWYGRPVAEREAVLDEGRADLEAASPAYLAQVTVTACAGDEGMIQRHLPALCKKLEQQIAHAPDEELAEILKRARLVLERGTAVP